jgi:hypothetical protein
MIAQIAMRRISPSLGIAPVVVIAVATAVAAIIGAIVTETSMSLVSALEPAHVAAAEAAAHVAAAEAAAMASTAPTASTRQRVGGTQASGEGSSQQDDHHLTYHGYTPSDSTIVKDGLGIVHDRQL